MQTIYLNHSLKYLEVLRGIRLRSTFSLVSDGGVAAEKPTPCTDGGSRRLGDDHKFIDLFLLIGFILTTFILLLLCLRLLTFGKFYGYY